MSLDLSTHIVIPGWVFRFRDGVPVASGDVRLFLAPTLDDIERQGLYFLLDHVIRQILTSGGTDFVFDFKKMEGLPEKSWKRVSALFLQLQLTRFPGNTTIKFFEKERWTYDPGKDNAHPLLECSLRDDALSLVLGYFSPLIPNTFEFLETLLPQNSPAIFSRSLWLDCSPKERDVLTLLERQLQNPNSCLHLDGHFEIPYSDISRAAKATSIEKEWDFIDRLGRKLRDHGWAIQGHTTEPFLRGITSPTSPALAWKIAPQLLTQPLSDTFEKCVAEFYFRRDFAQESLRARYLDFLTWGIHTPVEMNFINDFIEKSKKFNNIAYPLKVGATLFDLRLVFLEWTQRQKSGHRFPIPQTWRDAAAFKILVQVTEENAAAKFATFANILQNDLDFIHTATRTPELFCYKDFEQEQPTSYTVQQIAQPARSFEKEKKEPILDKGQLLKSKLRKMATDELEKIQRESPQDYIELKKKFFDSLDDQSRALMRGVQDRMQPTLFEQHIKARLIAFMVDHPSLWQFVSKNAVPRHYTEPEVFQRRTVPDHPRSHS